MQTSCQFQCTAFPLWINYNYDIKLKCEKQNYMYFAGKVPEPEIPEHLCSQNVPSVIVFMGSSLRSGKPTKVGTIHLKTGVSLFCYDFVMSV